MGVFEYQVSIVATIVIASLLIGRAGLLLVAAGWAIWTLVMIFTSWLIFFQFITIFVSFGIGAKIASSPNSKSYRSASWVFLVVTVGVIWFSNQKSNSWPAAAQVQQPVPAPPPQAAPLQLQQIDRPIDTPTLMPAAPIYVPAYAPQDAGDMSQYRIDPAEMRRMQEEARQTGQKFEYAIRQCGHPNPTDDSSFDRWSACMARYDQ